MSRPNSGYALRGEGSWAPGTGPVARDGDGNRIGEFACSIGTGGVDAGTMGVTRLAPQVSRAQRVLGLALIHQTAPQL